MSDAAPALPDPPLTAKAAATRKRLLDIAADMFIERGYEAVSLRDIAVAAGVTKGAIYGHFKSKGQLLVEVIRTQLSERDLEVDLETADDPSAFVDLFIDPGSRELRMLQIDAAAAARHDPDVAAGVREVHAERTAWIEATLAGSPDPTTLAFIINALSSGVGVQEAHERATPDPEAWRRTVAAMFAAATRSRKH